MGAQSLLNTRFWVLGGICFAVLGASGADDERKQGTWQATVNCDGLKCGGGQPSESDQGETDPVSVRFDVHRGRAAFSFNAGGVNKRNENGFGGASATVSCVIDFFSDSVESCELSGGGAVGWWGKANERLNLRGTASCTVSRIQVDSSETPIIGYRVQGNYSGALLHGGSHNSWSEYFEGTNEHKGSAQGQFTVYLYGEYNHRIDLSGRLYVTGSSTRGKNGAKGHYQPQLVFEISPQVVSDGRREQVVAPPVTLKVDQPAKLGGGGSLTNGVLKTSFTWDTSQTPSSDTPPLAVATFPRQMVQQADFSWKYEGEQHATCALRRVCDNAQGYDKQFDHPRMSDLTMSEEQLIASFQKVLEEYGEDKLSSEPRSTVGMLLYLANHGTTAKRGDPTQFYTGHEGELNLWVHDQSLQSVSPADLFEQALKLNDGNITDALLTSHNVLRAATRQCEDFNPAPQDDWEQAVWDKLGAMNDDEFNAYHDKCMDRAGPKEAKQRYLREMKTFTDLAARAGRISDPELYESLMPLRGQDAGAWYHLFGTACIAFATDAPNLKYLPGTDTVEENNSMPSWVGMSAADAIARLAVYYEEKRVSKDIDTDPNEYCVDLAGLSLGNALAKDQRQRADVLPLRFPDSPEMPVFDSGPHAVHQGGSLVVFNSPVSVKLTVPKSGRSVTFDQRTRTFVGDLPVHCVLNGEDGGQHLGGALLVPADDVRVDVEGTADGSFSLRTFSYGMRVGSAFIDVPVKMGEKLSLPSSTSQTAALQRADGTRVEATAHVTVTESQMTAARVQVREGLQRRRAFTLRHPAQEGWKDDGSGCWQAIGGAYRMTGRHVHALRAARYSEQIGDLVLEADVRKTEGDRGTEVEPFGLDLRADSTGGRSYFCAVTANGQFAILRRDGKDSQPLHPWSTSPALVSGLGHWNHLKVVAVGPRLTFYANGQRLAEVEDSAYAKGRIGLSASESATSRLPDRVEFADVTLIVGDGLTELPPEFERPVIYRRPLTLLPPPLLASGIADLTERLAGHDGRGLRRLMAERVTTTGVEEAGEWEPKQVADWLAGSRWQVQEELETVRAETSLFTAKLQSEKEGQCEATFRWALVGNEARVIGLEVRRAGGAQPPVNPPPTGGQTPTVTPPTGGTQPPTDGQPALPAGWPAWFTNYRPAQGVSLRVSPIDGMPQVLVPGGTFSMGSPPQAIQATSGYAQQASGGKFPVLLFNAEGPQRQVTVDAFWIDLHEVTVSQYCNFLNATHPAPPIRRRYLALRGELPEGDQSKAPPQIRQNGDTYLMASEDLGLMPVYDVSHDGAMAYAAWAQRSLPTEAQWERAARGGQEGSHFAWGSDLKPNAKVENLPDESAKRQWQGWTIIPGYDDGSPTVARIASFMTNGFGLYDLCGNVSEWCLDWYSPTAYATLPARNPVNLQAGQARVVRGANWTSMPWTVHTAYRGPWTPDQQQPHIGFRCAAPGP